MYSIPSIIVYADSTSSAFKAQRENIDYYSDVPYII